LILKRFDREFETVARAAVRERETVDIVGYLAILNREFALAKTKNNLIRTTRFGEDNNVFAFFKRWHAGNVKFQVADLSADRRQFESSLGLAFKRLIDIDDIAGEDQLSVATPVRPRALNLPSDYVLSLFYKIFERQALDCRGAQERGGEQNER
jgi:hypothetical protein